MGQNTCVYNKISLLRPSLGACSQNYVASVTPERVMLTCCRVEMDEQRMERMGDRVKLNTYRMRVEVTVREFI